MSVGPGSTIGIFGGGQLARMTALAARAMGYDVIVLDPNAACCAAPVASQVIAARFDDVEAAAELGRRCDVITYEIERVSIAALRAAADFTPVRPSPDVLAVVQDRARQKAWLASAGFPMGPWRAATDGAAAAVAAGTLGLPCHVKRTRGGYDGRGQARVAHGDDVEAVVATLGQGPFVVEQELPLTGELSVLVATSPSGKRAIYPAAQNWHQGGILSHSVLPGAFAPSLARRAEELAAAIATRLGVVGLLVVEMFVAHDELWINELAPRPHNSFHASELASYTSQFEQLVRAVCDLPLGAVQTRAPTALVNLLGDLWLDPRRRPALEEALALGGVTLRLYGKEPLHARKVGHLLASAATSAEAVALARTAFVRLAGNG